MTAYLVLLAQTRVGFLSGGRGKTFHQLTQQEQDAQKEEAFARATVALTRAQQICIIMGPLDMRGLVGGSNHYGLPEIWGLLQLDKCGFVCPVGIEHFFDAFCFSPQRAKTQNPKQVSLNPKAQLPQITSPANLLLDTRTRTNQGGWLSFSL